MREVANGPDAQGSAHGQRDVLLPHLKEKDYVIKTKKNVKSDGKG